EYRETGAGSADHLDRFAFETAGVVELTDMLRHGGARGHVNDRLGAEDDHGGHWFLAREAFIAMNAAMFSRRDVEEYPVAIQSHHSIGAHINGAAIGIGGNCRITRAQVASAIFLMPARRRKLAHVDFAAVQNIFHHRSIL